MPDAIYALGIDQLPREERLKLVQQIWDTIADEPVPLRLTEHQQQILSARIHDDTTSPVDGCSWEEVKSAVSQRLASKKQ